MIRLGHLIENLSVIEQRQKSVCEVFGYVEYQSILGTQDNGPMLLEGRRVGAKIDNDVVHGTLSASNQPDLWIGIGLEMHPPQGSLPLIEGDVALDK
jgi:hypothetical protein